MIIRGSIIAPHFWYFPAFLDNFPIQIKHLSVRQTSSFGTGIIIQSLVLSVVFLNEIQRKKVSLKRAFRDKKKPTEVGVSPQTNGRHVLCSPRSSVSALGARSPKRPLVDHVRPILQHRPTLISIFGLVVNRSHTLLFVCEALLDPIGVIACLM